MANVSAKLQPYQSQLPFRRVEFPTYDGTVLRGNFYHGKDAKGPTPIVIFCHGIGLVKEQYLENWFAPVVHAGYVNSGERSHHCHIRMIWIQKTTDYSDELYRYHVLSYDHRSFGHSDGHPRDNFDWIGQAEDFIDAVTFVRALPEVIEDKVFGWGVAHAGGLIAM
jgi:hypothetical protein